MPRSLLNFIKIIIWLAAVLIVAAMSLAPDVKLSGDGDKLAHFAIYALLAFFPVFVFERRALVITGAVMLFALSILIEVLQFYSPGREASLYDLIFNAGGIAAGLFISSLIKKGLKTSY